MNRIQTLLIGLVVGAALAVPIGLSAQDVTKTLGPGFYQIAVGSEALFAWRINTANGTTSYCAAPSDPTSKAPVCSPWSAGVIKEPR
jgi:hypothetical protein